MSDREYITKCLQEAERKIEDLSESEKHHFARRFLVIEKAVSAMGGWANFQHWTLVHAGNYFETCKILKKRVEELESALGMLENFKNWTIYSKFADTKYNFNETSVFTEYEKVMKSSAT